MSNKTGISVEVVQSEKRALINDIRNLDERTEKRLREIIETAGLGIQSKAKQLSPVNFGFLQNSVYRDYKSRVDMGQQSALNIAGRTPPNITIPTPTGRTYRDGLDVIVGSDLEYAKAQDDKRRFLTEPYNDWKTMTEKAINKALKEEAKK